MLYPFSFLGGGNTNSPRVQAFLTATGITDPTIVSALNDLDNALITAGLLPSGTGAGLIKALYPFVGGTATTHKFNFVNPLDTDAAYRLQFFGGWTHNANGGLPNGTNAYANTFIILGSVFSINDLSFGGYFGNMPSASDRPAMGAIAAPSFSQLYPRGAGNIFYGDVNDGASGSTSNSDSSGFLAVSRVNSTQKNQYIRGTSNVYSVGSVASIFEFLFLGTRNNNGSPDGGYFNAELKLAYCSQGLTSGQLDSFNTIANNFQTALGRA